MAIIVPKNNVKQFITNVMLKLGVTGAHAESLADVLLAGDYRGHYSHGINRIGTKLNKKLGKFFILFFCCTQESTSKMFNKDRVRKVVSQ